MTLWERPPWFLLVAISVIWHYLSILHELAKLWKDGNVSFFLGKIWPIATWLVLADLVLYLAVRRHFCDLVGMNWAGGDSDKTLAGPYYGAGVWDRELGWGCVFVCMCWGGTPQNWFSSHFYPSSWELGPRRIRTLDVLQGWAFCPKRGQSRLLRIFNSKFKLTSLGLSITFNFQTSRYLDSIEDDKSQTHDLRVICTNVSVFIF